jgi:hypothetical protein
MRKKSDAQPALFALDPSPLEPAEKRTPKRAAKSPPPTALRTAQEKSGADGLAWKMNGKHAVAYLRCPALASELLATDSRHLAREAMAIYYDRKGKAFAWQVRFDAERWEEVTARLG